ncbi:MAG: EAL domain-containing protein [Parvibaculum sp.]|uniref:EAL domain-containing protein n=1 Tax=Parvibaculum sp. TaxID=2024848 RepID=UPI00284876A8|nr:EAL domain-containing protein [Parvibaculum sp.]MDR3500072.1 EAL domain-containing protein [Parvibaculum sp.]
MSTTKNIFAASLYILPSIALALVLPDLMGLDQKLSMLAGLIACLLGAEAHAAIARGVERRLVRRELAELTGVAKGLAHELDQAGERIVELEERFERETTQRMERIFSEIRVVESLVKRLAETREAPPMPAIGAAQVQAKLAEAFEAPAPKVVPDISKLTDTELLETIRRSLEQNRVDLYLQPIVGLPQRKVRYYEGLSRLRSEEGALIMPRDYMRVAEPAGMMPTVDNILLFRCIQVVRKLASRNKDAGVFCNISAFSLLDSDFFPQFVEYMQHNQDLAQHLIFEFSQTTVNGMGPIEEESLAALANLGFRFSMDQVTNLKINVPQLHARNFRFAKIPASLITSGLHAQERAGIDIHASDLKELLRRSGIQLIVDKIETEREVVDVLDLNVELGQGYLFGEPRPVREEVTRPVETAAAA